MKKKITLALAALAVVGLAGYFAVNSSQVRAAGPNGSLIDTLVERFNLNEDEVGQVIDQVREQRRQEMQARCDVRLDEAVEEGAITEGQKQALIEKREQMQEERGEHHQEMEKWMEENGIDPEVLGSHGGFGGRGPGFHGKGW